MNEAQRMHLRLHDALRAGDLEGARHALGNPIDFANARDGYLNIPVLSYAIGLAPIEFVRTLLEAGADPDARTRIDDFATPLEEALRFGWDDAVRALQAQRR